MPDEVSTVRVVVKMFLSLLVLYSWTLFVSVCLVAGTMTCLM